MDTPYAVNQERWSKMSIFDQMGNISSEVGRSFNAKRHNNDIDRMQAVGRAIDLFDATVTTLVANKSPKLKELLRAKEAYLTAVFNKTNPVQDDQNLEKYFMQYAIAARLNR